MRLNEARTRAELINPQLSRAEWDLNDRTRVRFEVPVAGYDPTPWNGFTDFSLYDATGQVIGQINTIEKSRDVIHRLLSEFADAAERLSGLMPK